MSINAATPAAALTRLTSPVMLLGAGLLYLLSGAPVAAAEPVQPNDFIATFGKIFGEHPGMRKGHAKGFCVSGHFQGDTAAASYNDGMLFNGQQYPLIGRFSMAGGNPQAAENSRSPRGFGLQIQLPSGSYQQLALLSTPVFGAKDPASFLGLLKASVPGKDGKPNPAAIAAYRASHPDTQAQAKYLATSAPPASYGSTFYYGLHTFYLQKGQQQTAVRWQLAPVDGVAGLTDAEIASKPTEFLQQRLSERLKKGPVQFRWQLVMAAPSDQLLDPSQAWPAKRSMVPAGVITLTALGGDACERVNFDPNVLASGITASADPVLQMRSAAYAISFGKRVSGQ